MQDGVTAAVFSDGKLVQTLDGGIYRFSNETVRVPGKPALIKTPQGEEKPTVEEKQSTEEKKRGFLSRLFGAKKETKPVEAASKPVVNKPTPKPAVTPQRNTSGRH